MRWLGPVLAAGAVLSACPPSGGTADGGSLTGKDGGNAQALFDLVALDSQEGALRPLSLAVRADDRVSVAYFVASGDDSELRYVTWSPGAAAPTQPEAVRVVQRVHGVSLALRGDGSPAVAYLGGGSDNSVFWLQSDAAVSYRNANGTWTERVAATMGDQAPCTSTVSNRGFLVGLNPSLAFRGDTAFLAYRDGHDGQFPQQDWAASDLELVEGGPTSWTFRCLAQGGDDKRAYGGHIQLVTAGNDLALVHDRVLGSADGTGQDVLFQRQPAGGAWTAPQVVLPIGNTQSGAALAFDAQEGFGIAVVDRSNDRLSFVQSADGVTWTVPDPVFESGTGGWYPSLAYDPVHHEPAIAFVICSNRSGVAEGNCPEDEDSLQVTQRIGENWRTVEVDAQSAYLPKLAFLSSGKRVVAFRNAQTGALWLAVER